MTTLTITTDKTRAEMVTELTNWADATQVGGYDYVWACADDINVSATIDISGFNLIFTNAKRLFATTNGTINVSSDFIDRYNYPTKITFSNASDVDTEMVGGNGKWVGKGLSIAVNGGNIRFNSSTSLTNLEDLSVDAIKSSVSALRVLLHANGVINLYRVTGMTVIRYSGVLSMNPHGAGLVSSQSYGSAKLVAINSTFTGFVISSDATHRTQTASSAYNATTMTFVDGKVNPEFLDAYPKDNDGVIRIIKRTLTLNPKDSVGTNITGFKYRVLSKRVVMPGGAVTDDYVVVSSASADYGGNYLMTVWRGVRATGSSGYNPLRDITIDKELTVKVRKYKYNEGEFKANSYYYAQETTPTLEVDTFAKADRTVSASFTDASQFYDSVRASIARDMELPEDLLTTDGVTITIKPTWTLKRSTSALSTIIDKTSKSITIDKNSYIAKYASGKWDYTSFTGTVDDSMTGHTNMIFARTDGKANLVLNITCPAGSKDPVAAIWPFSQGLDNRANLITGQTTGTGVRNITLIVDATVKYYCIAKAIGANLYRPFPIEPVGGLGGSQDITLFVYEKNDGTQLFPDTLTPAQIAVGDTLEFHTTHIDVKIPTDFATNPRWSSTDKIWQYQVDDFIAIAYKLDVIQTALTLSVARNQLVFMQEGRLLISAAANDKILEQDPDNKTIVSSTTNIKVSFTTISMGRIGDKDARNTFIDNVNGTIDVRGGVPINGGFSIADANRLVVVETKANETHQRLALDATKPLTSKPDGGITSTGIAITATELEDGSVVQTRGT